MQTISNQSSYSQSQEDLFVLDYFKGYVGTLLEIGANEGEFLSNSKLLIENEWSAYLVEPGETYKKLFVLHNGNEKVKTYNIGIGETDMNKVQFFESGAHVLNGTDNGLVSTVNFEETKRWPDVRFKESVIDLVSWDTFYKSIGKPKLDFISIDTEGFDFLILKQMDLDDIGCRCLCIEHNSHEDLILKYRAYCEGFGMKQYLINGENIIFVR